MKKIFALLLALILALSLFGCGQKADDPADDAPANNDPKPSDKVEDPADEPEEEKKLIGFENATCAKHRVFRALVGIGCVGIVFGAFSILPFAFLELIGWKFVKYFLTVLVGAFFVPFLFKKLKI